MANVPARDVQFRNPPVVEVVLSVQFEPLHELDGAHIGLYWAEIKEKFPHAQQHPRLEPVVERFDTSDFNPRFVRVELGATVPRYWFLNQKQSELVQVQDDRFIHNWRKVADPYPRYEGIRQTFAAELAQFERFLHREGIGQINPQLAEVSYINHLGPITSPFPFSRPDEVLNLWSPGEGFGKPYIPETVEMRHRFVISEGSRKVGRLYVELQPANRQPDRAPIWLLVLTARGLPLADGLEGALRFLDLGRREMLAAFISITRRDLQDKWERVQ